MRTQRMYIENPYLKEFEAAVLDILKFEDKYGLLLDRTAFYPEGGGQPYDTGYLNEAEVLQVIEKDGEILHIVRELPESREVKGTIDWTRRFDFMQQHTGQHILSACFERLLNGSTDSFHLGKDIVSIEINIESFSSDDAEQLEKMANDIIYSNLPVTARIVTSEELQRIPLRKQPKVTENIRIVEIRETDYSPCGGTHVSTTGEVGMIKIKTWEKCKGGIRFTFMCGGRALKDYSLQNSIIRTLGEKLSVRDTEIAEAVGRILNDLKSTEKQLSSVTRTLMGYEADEIIREYSGTTGIKLVRRIFDGRNIEDVKLMAQHLTQVPGTVALLACRNENAQVIFTRSEDVNLDMNAIFKAVMPIIGGKGGGNARTAQGGGSGIEKLEEFLNSAENLVRTGIQP